MSRRVSRVVAILNTPAPGQPVQVLAQYTYEPYGGRAVAEEPGLTNGTENIVGHQGLFFYRLNTGDTPLAPSTVGLYYNRNRWYSPQLGRFIEKDPNESGMLVVEALARNGEALAAALGAFGATGHYSSSMNLYGYVGANPVNRGDPLGLYDAFAEMDSLVADRIGNALYTLGAMNEKILGLRTAVNMAASFLPGAGLYEAFRSVQVIADGKGGFWDAVNIATVAFPLVKQGIKLAAGIQSARIAMKGLMKVGKYVSQALRACGKMVGHHTIPGSVLKQLEDAVPAVYRQVQTRSRGANKIIWEIPEDVHGLNVHAGVGIEGVSLPGGQWNTAWENEIAAAGGYSAMTVDKMYEIRDKLVVWFDLEQYRPR